MDFLERNLTAFRNLICKSDRFLRAMISLTHGVNELVLTTAFASQYGKEPRWIETAVILNLISWLYLYGILEYSLYFRNRNNTLDVESLNNVRAGSSVGQHPNHPIMLAMRRETGKILALTMFTLLDAILKQENSVLIVIFCTSFFLHLLHLMVFFGIKEDYDFAGGFLAASFSLLYEMCITWWNVIELFVVITIMACYKGILIEGVEALGLG